MRRFWLGGGEVEIVSPAWNVEAARDAERPVGEWNTLDLYVVELQLRRLKKRKLMLKDQIMRLESELIPDLNA